MINDRNNFNDEPRRLIKKWKDSGEENFRAMAYEVIRKYISKSGKKELFELTPRNNTKITVDIVARVNFGGVFTDIPPYCYENGGAVINAPVLCNGKYPIRAVVSSINRAGFEFEIVPGEEKCFVDSVSDLKVCEEDDYFGLHKAVCDVCGVKGGVGITTESRLPLGSGLGTSSILAAAIIKGLYRLFGYDSDDCDVVNKVFETEQFLGTRGGWQDPCGGLYKGMKMCQCNAGLPLNISTSAISMKKETEAELRKRMIIFYSGETRKAGNILSDIAEGYLLGYEKVIRAYEEGHAIAIEMKSSLEKGNLKRFGRLMTAQHAVNKELSHLHSTNEIESLLASVHNISDGSMITGAGGGGYIAVLLKKGRNIGDFEKCIGKKITDETVMLDFGAEPYKIHESNF